MRSAINRREEGMPQDSNPSTNKSFESNHIFHSTTVMGEKMFRENVVNNRTIKRKHHRRFGLEKCFLLPRYLQINVINCCRLSGSEITLKMRVIPMEFHSFAKPFRWKCLPIDYVNRKRHTFDVKFYLSLFFQGVVNIERALTLQFKVCCHVKGRN